WDLAFDNAGNLFVVNHASGLVGNAAVYKITPNGVRTTFASGSGNLLVVDPGAVSSAGSVIPNAIYKFTPQGARSTFASGPALGESFACLAFQPIPCCE